MWPVSIAAVGGVIAGVPLSLFLIIMIGPLCTSKEVWGFLGSLTGAGIGLVALVIGAVLNAELNRRRDDRLENQEKLSILGAISADIEIEIKTIDNHKEDIEKKGLTKIRGKGIVLSANESEIFPIIKENLFKIDSEIIHRYVEFRGYIWTIGVILSDENSIYGQNAIINGIDDAIAKGNELNRRISLESKKIMKFSHGKL